jgi:UDP-glucose 4-epimerase
MNKTDLVVGGAGFIGSQLCDALLAKGDEVVCIDNFMRGSKANLKEALKNLHFHFFELDANKADELADLMIKFHVDYVYHLAANSDIEASAKNPSIEFSCTASTTWNVLTAMRDAGVKKLFFASSSAIYGEVPGLISEDTSYYFPISYYGGAKLASEAFIKSFAHMNDMECLIFRFPNVIGPRLTHGAVFDFIRRLQKDPSELYVLGDGSQTKPYIYSTDLIAAIVPFSEKNQEQVAIYNVGLETATSVKTIAEIVVEEMGLKGKTKIIYGTGKIGWKGDVPHFQYDLTKVHAAGWHATLTSDEAVRKTVRKFIGKE